LQKLASLVVIALMVGLILRAPSVSAPGYGARCINRHDASFQSVIVKAAATNYTGSGMEELASVPWGYDITVILFVHPNIMATSVLQPPTDNGSIFFANDITGTWSPHCYANINLMEYTYMAFSYHVANLSAPFNTTSHQTVTLSTGTHIGQYNVSWLGP
jgi:hypothetical protein